MLGSLVLETAIGLVFVYLIFSLIASAIAEYLSALLDRRGEHLKHTLFNLFDNDDPKGRAFLNLFVAHPMIQSLNTTTWKPSYQSALERFDEEKGRFERARGQWQAASAAVAAADAARDAAKAADAASSKVVSTLKTFVTTDAAQVQALQAFVAEADAAAEKADSAAAAARAAGIAVKQARSDDANLPVPGPVAGTSSSAAAPSAGDPESLARRAADRATRAASAARSAAAAAEQAKRGLDSELLDLVVVPKYIPDRAFVDALMHLLTAEETRRALDLGGGADDQMGTTPDAPTPPFWDRYGAALKVVGGVASRLDDGEAKTEVLRRIASIEGYLRLAADGSIAAAAVIGRLEGGTDELRAAIAGVRDDALRAALEREVETSLRPLHALSRDVLSLHRAAQTITLMADSSIKTALSAFLARAGDDLDAFRQGVGSWFNDVMDHTSGWYKRNTQRILLAIAVVLCVLNNVDSVSLVGHLSTDPQARAASAKEAVAFLEASSFPAAGGMGEARKPPADQAQIAAHYRSSLQAMTIPLWWTRREWDNLWYASDGSGPKAEALGTTAPPTAGPALAPEYRFSPNYTWIIAKFTGLLISILAVSMGAPFWFDVLNKLVNVRLVGKRPDPTVTEPPPAAAPASPTAGAGA